MASGLNIYLSLYKHLLTNDAKELTPYRFEFEPNANQIRKDHIWQDLNNSGL
jgi:hypothetical protein